MKKTKKPKSPLAKFLQAKLDAKKKDGKFGVLGKDLSGDFSSGEYVPTAPKRGGRNGSGKP
jgi:hypothetical protein